MHEPSYRLIHSTSEEPAVQRCRFVGLRRAPSGLQACLELEGEAFLADLANPETLHGDLPYGAEIEVAFSGPGGTRAELRLGSEDRLEPSLKEALRDCFGVGFGGLLQTESGWDYLVFEEGEDRDSCFQGKLVLRGPTAFLMPPLRSWTLRKSLLDRAWGALRPSPLRIQEWQLSDPDGLALRNANILELRIEDLEGERFASIAADLGREYYWSERFDTEFYRAQARRGFIAVAHDRGDRAFLLPTLHPGYAVLDWQNLHRSRSLDRLFRSGRLEALGVRLVLNPDIEPVLRELERRWGGSSWILPEYRELVRELAAERTGGFRVLGVELRVDGQARPVAGELGYRAGRTYTSLSGFLRLERREWSGLGKVQLHLLAEILRDSGCAFWNLGMPKMQYKYDLGARLVPRSEFLERWSRAVEEQ